MKRHTRWWKAAVLGCTIALTVTACGSSGSSSTSSSPGSAPGQNGGTQDAVSGGTLNMLGAGDVDYMDPNISYYSVGYLALRLWSRQLFTFPASPGQTTVAVPDLATDIPTVANGGISQDQKTYRITIK
jgi:peptide/nickel transport system substrate-binding protein